MWSILLLLLAPPVRHSATLTWVDDLNQRTATYNIYKVEGTCADSSKMTMIATDVVEKTFEDTDIKQNRTYAYIVRAVNWGEESLPSECVEGVVPRAGNEKETK